MAFNAHERLTPILCGLAIVLGLGVATLVAVLTHRRGPTLTEEICWKCGAFRTKSVWELPGTKLGAFRRAFVTNTVVSQAIRDAGLNEWGHAWLTCSERLPTPPPPLKPKANNKLVQRVSGAVLAASELPGVRLRYQYNSPDVARWVVALHQRGEPGNVKKWMGWLADPNMSPFLLGTSVRYRLQEEALRDGSRFNRWLDEEESKLVWGHRPESR